MVKYGAPVKFDILEIKSTLKFDRKCLKHLQVDWSKLVELSCDWLTYVKFLVFNILDINLTLKFDPNA